MKVVFITVGIRVQIDGDIHVEVRPNIDVKQGCPLSPHYFGLNIDKLETCLNEIDRDLPCLFNIVVVILLYANMLSYSPN